MKVQHISWSQVLPLPTPTSDTQVHQLQHHFFLSNLSTWYKPLVLPLSGLHPYICKGVHFTDRGESLVATYTESHTVWVSFYCNGHHLWEVHLEWNMSLNPGLLRRAISFKHECKCKCIGFQQLWSMMHSRFSILEGDNLFISNLSNSINLYSICTMQRLWVCHYCQYTSSDCSCVASSWSHCFGRYKGFQVYDRTTGELVDHLEHKTKGCIQVVDVSLLKK